MGTKLNARPFNCIDFEGAADGADISNRYQSLGVTLAAITTNPPSRKPVFARSTTWAASGSSVVSIFATGAQIFNSQFGGIEAVFKRAVGWVAVNSMAVLGNAWSNTGTPLSSKPFLQAFDAAGNVIATTYHPGASFSAWVPLTVSTANGLPGIAKVVFSCILVPADKLPVYATFDDLCFGTQPYVQLGPKADNRILIRHDQRLQP